MPTPATSRVLGLVLLAGSLPAQASRRAAAEDGPHPESVTVRSVGLQEVDDHLVAVGRDYRARFDARGVTFTPALGPRAPRNLPWRFALTSVERASTPVGTTTQAAEPVEPSVVRGDAGLMVHYDRGDVVESYAVRTDGIEQSFVFAELPRGQGDLVVRGGVETDLAPSRDGSRSTSLSFLGQDLGGVRIGMVTGIDADGDRARGSMLYLDGHLELRLPAEFVDRATLPLILDPLISSAVPVAANQNANPDVAYDATNDVYLVVWEQTLSLGDTDILGQRVHPDGTMVGGTIVIHSTPARSQTPAVANVNQHDQFVVAFVEGTITGYGNIMAVTVDAATGVATSAVTVSNNPTYDHSCPDVGGDNSETTSRVVFVWETAIKPNWVSIRHGMATATGALNLNARVRQAGFCSDCCLFPRVSPTPGPGGYLVAFQYVIAPLFYPRIQEVRVELTEAGSSTRPSLTLAPTGLLPSKPDVAGDGTSWLVVYHRYQVSGGGTDVVCKRVELDATTQQLTAGAEVAVAANPGQRERDASLTHLGDSYLVTYLTGSLPTGPFSLRAKSVDPFTCGACESESTVAPAPLGTSGRAAIGSQWAGSPRAGESALIAWHVFNGGTFSSFTRRYVAADGASDDVGGGCTSGGTARATCAVVGNAGFTHRLRGGPPGAPTFLVLSLNRIDFPCGPCTLVPNPLTGGLAVAAGVTDGSGHAALSTPLPGSPRLLGASLLDQWVTVAPGAECTLIQSVLSNAINIRIE